jgi:hypothetical protein
MNASCFDLQLALAACADSQTQTQHQAKSQLAPLRRLLLASFVGTAYLSIQLD